MKNNQIAEYNVALRNKSALEIVRWGIARANGHALISTNFRPFEAVILHLCIQVQPDIPVLWVDHGYNCQSALKFLPFFQKTAPDFTSLIFELLFLLINFFQDRR